jgi:hypothetical protein
MLRNTHKSRCFLWRKNDPEVNYSPTRISGGSVSRGGSSNSKRDGRIILKWIFRKWEGVVGTGWS